MSREKNPHVLEDYDNDTRLRVFMERENEVMPHIPHVLEDYHLGFAHSELQ